MSSGVCKSCGAPLIWVRLMPRGTTAPLNPEPAPTGNIRMLGANKAVARVLAGADLLAARKLGEHLYTSHFATCPSAAKHRKGTA